MKKIAVATCFVLIGCVIVAANEIPKNSLKVEEPKPELLNSEEIPVEFQENVFPSQYNMACLFGKATCIFLLESFEINNTIFGSYNYNFRKDMKAVSKRDPWLELEVAAGASFPATEVR